MDWVYRGYDGETTGPAPILLRLEGWLRSEDSGGKFLGIMPSAAHRQQSPRSVHNSGRALDWGPSSDGMGWHLAHIMAAYPDGADLDGLLWKDYQWGFREGPVWTYTGRHDHDTHIHIETRGWE